MILLIGILLVVSVLLLIHLAMYAYVDAPEHGMSPKKWAVICFFIPLFGFFTYLFEREERNSEDNRRRFTEKGFEVHESRADDVTLNSDDSDSDDP